MEIKHKNLSEVIEDLQNEILKYEGKYKMSSEEMLRALKSGMRLETHELEDWALKWSAYNWLLTFQ